MLPARMHRIQRAGEALSPVCGTAFSMMTVVVAVPSAKETVAGYSPTARVFRYSGETVRIRLPFFIDRYFASTGFPPMRSLRKRPYVSQSTDDRFTVITIGSVLPSGWLYERLSVAYRPRYGIRQSSQAVSFPRADLTIIR